MTTEAAAAELGVSRWAVLKAIHDKRLTSVKDGRDHFIHEDELARFKRERRPRGRPRKTVEYLYPIAGEHARGHLEVERPTPPPT